MSTLQTPTLVASGSVETLDIRTAPGMLPTVTLSSVGEAVSWVQQHREVLRHTVANLGCVLVRGLDLADPDQVGPVFRELATELITEREPFASRTRYSEGIYGSTHWPAAQPMCMHHELSYLSEVPSLMMFACLDAAQVGGATAVSDAHEVLTALPKDVVDRFDRQGWVLVRNYNEDIGARVAKSFGTEDRAGIEAYCRANGIEYDWQPGGSLRTKQRRPAVVRHPQTGHRCWFNQVAFLSEWALDPEIREYLIEVNGADGLPFTTTYGDGEPIGSDVIEAISEVYERLTIREPWQPGDLLLVDNIRTAHSREAYRGPRTIVVGMADPVRFPAPQDTGHEGRGTAR